MQRQILSVLFYLFLNHGQIWRVRHSNICLISRRYVNPAKNDGSANGNVGGYEPDPNALWQKPKKSEEQYAAAYGMTICRNPAVTPVPWQPGFISFIIGKKTG